MEKVWDENIFFENFEFFKIFGKKKTDFDENEPTGFVFHGKKETNLKEGFRRRGNPPGNLGKNPNGPWKDFFFWPGGVQGS